MSINTAKGIEYRRGQTTDPYYRYNKRPLQQPTPQTDLDTLEALNKLMTAVKVHGENDMKKVKFKHNKTPLQQPAPPLNLDTSIVFDKFAEAVRTMKPPETPKPVMESRPKQSTEGKCKSIWQTHSIEETLDFEGEDLSINAPATPNRYRTSYHAPSIHRPPILDPNDPADSDAVKQTTTENTVKPVHESAVESPQEIHMEEIRIGWSPIPVEFTYSMNADGSVVQNKSNPIKKKAKRIKYSKLLEEFANSRKLSEDSHNSESDDIYIGAPIKSLKINGKSVMVDVNGKIIDKVEQDKTLSEEAPEIVDKRDYREIGK